MLDFTQLRPEQHLDFWLGEWEVSWGDQQQGTNHIQRILDSRVIQENFDGAPALTFRGMSVSVYSPTLERWPQTWVDSEGSYWAFEGGPRTMSLFSAPMNKPMVSRLNCGWSSITLSAMNSIGVGSARTMAGKRGR